MSLQVPRVHPGWVSPADTQVIAAGNTHDTTTAVAIVLCARLLANGKIHEYVTGELYEHTLVGWGSGHYFNHYDDAHKDYVKRIKRGY